MAKKITKKTIKKASNIIKDIEDSEKNVTVEKIENIKEYLNLKFVELMAARVGDVAEKTKILDSAQQKIKEKILGDELNFDQLMRVISNFSHSNTENTNSIINLARPQGENSFYQSEDDLEKKLNENMKNMTPEDIENSQKIMSTFEKFAEVMIQKTKEIQNEENDN